MHDLEYGQWHHSIALTALGLGLFLAVLAIQSLRKQLEALQARDRAANTHKAPFCQERKNDHQVTPSSDLVCLVAKDNDGGEGAGPQL